jgi:hypothetical protein
MTTQDTIDIIDKHGWQNTFKRATNPINLPISSKWISGHIDNGDKLQFIEQKERGEVLRLNAKGDTLEIKSSSIKYIKIDGKTYEIRRTTKLINQEEGKSQYTKEELNFLNSAHSTDDYNWRLGIINLLKRNQK